MRVAILCDGREVSLWQRRAIEAIAADNELLLLICDRAPAPRRALRHSFYFALNLFTIRNRLTRPVPFPRAQDRIAASLGFTPRYEGAWAVLPDDVLAWVREQRVDAIVKFNLDLLRIPAASLLPVPILSYHHGDPRDYRGRPAGFHEIRNREKFVGQIVQILSNRLDAGTVLAFAQSRVLPHSYRKTLLEAFRISPYLLPSALAALRDDRALPLEPAGRNYRLPGNLMVVRFLAVSFRSLLGHLAYGAFVEKRWKVATLRMDEPLSPLQLVAQAQAMRANWDVPALLPGYTFYADSFFHTGPGDLLIEAMKGATGKGELIRIRDGKQQRIGGFGGHISYPMSIAEDGHHYILPEIAGWKPPTLYSIDDGAAREVARLDIDEDAILDPTLLRVAGRLFLFGNRPRDGSSVLHLWSAPSLFARFERHPSSPIRVSVRGSRMAGEILETPRGPHRLGQDFRKSYGDGILAFRIEAINAEIYREVEIGEAAFTTVSGPHTLNLRGDMLAFDWYTERRSPLAGVRRVLNKLPGLRG